MRRRFQNLTTSALVTHMQNSVALARSFRHGGDTWWIQAEQAAQELELRGWRVGNDWGVCGKHEG